MDSGSNPFKFFIKVLGNTLGTQINILERLQSRLHLRQVYSEDECDVIIAFVPVVSRAGTDIEAALKKIETTKPVVLVVLHGVTEENYIPPQSKWCVQREGVFAVDFLFNEDEGLLRSLYNDTKLKSTTDYLISIGASPNVPLDPRNFCRGCTWWEITCLVLLVCLIVGLISVVIYIIVEPLGETHDNKQERKWKDRLYSSLA